MRIAITGASGFVGRHVLRELQARDLEIVALSRKPAQLPGKNINTRIIQLDISKQLADPYELMGKPDVLIHLAWDGLPNYDSISHMKMELPVQLRFLDACLASGLRKLVVSGTCFEYGQIPGELSEDQIPHPCTQYGTAKTTLHKHLEEMQHLRTYQLAWLRLFYLYGTGQAPNSLYSSLMNAIRRGDPTFDMSGGEQLRDFLSIRDAARMIADIALLQTDVGIVNVCSGEPVSIRDLAMKWIKETNSSITLNLGKLPYSDYEPMAFWGNRKKLDSLLGAT